MNRRSFLSLFAAVPLAAKFLPSLVPVELSGIPQVIPDWTPIADPEFIQGLRRVGSLTFTTNFPKDPMALVAGASMPMRVEFGDGLRCDFEGRVNQVNTSEPIDGLCEARVTVQPTGPIQFTEAPPVPTGPRGLETLLMLGDERLTVQEIEGPPLDRDIIELL